MTTLSAIRFRVVGPEPEIEPWEWLERNVVSIPYSPQPGGFDSSIDPSIRQVIGAICDPAINIVVLRCAVQKWKTLALELSIAWGVVNDPAPTIFFQDTDANARDEMQFRMRPLLDNVRGVRELVPSGADKDAAKNTSILFRNGMALWLLGASNPRNRQRRSIRRVFLDECWQYPKNQKAIDEASKRATAFGYLGKVVLASQGSDEGDEFESWWLKTTMAVESVQCPECAERVAIDWKNVEWDTVKDDDGNYDFRAIGPTARYKCPSCSGAWPDEDETRRDLRQTIQYLPQNASAPASSVGFCATALLSMPLSKLVEEYLRAKVAMWKGDAGPMKLFYQQRLAQSWGEQEGGDFNIEIKLGGYALVDGFDWPEEATIGRKAGVLVVAGPENLGSPGYLRCRSMTIDVQSDCFWYCVRSWSPDGASRLIMAGRATSYDQLDVYRQSLGVTASMVFVDSGNQPYAEVYPEAAKRGWTCLRGDRALTYHHKARKAGKDGKETLETVERYYSKVRKVPLGKKGVARVHFWSNLSCKDILARLLRMPERWGVPDDIETQCADYLPQMDSERRKQVRGHWRWQQIGDRANHLWDCEAMQVVVGLMVKVIGGEVMASELGDEEKK
jgi:hypothetical protein